MADTQSTDSHPATGRLLAFLRRHRLVVTLLGITVLFFFYIDKVSTNPPGFYIDESAIAYNAYCIAHTGAGEFRNRFPLFFPVYTGGAFQQPKPTPTIPLANPLFLFSPSIKLAPPFTPTGLFG